MIQIYFLHILYIVLISNVSFLLLSLKSDTLVNKYPSYSIGTPQLSMAFLKQLTCLEKAHNNTEAASSPTVAASGLLKVAVFKYGKFALPALHSMQIWIYRGFIIVNPWHSSQINRSFNTVGTTVLCSLYWYINSNLSFIN